MKQQIKWMVIMVASLTALLATVFSAYATAPGLGRAARVLPPAAAPEGGAAALLACTKMTGSEVAWVTLTDAGDIDEQVNTYPSGTNLITPLFEYNCVPSKATIVTIFSLNGEPIFSDKESLKASNTKALYAYPLGTTDASPLDEGEWGVEFYNNKTLLTSGSTTVGNTDASNQSATVEGTVLDKRTKKPVNGAVILVLKPGVSVQTWVKGGQKDADVFTAGKSDSKGQFTLQKPLARETTLSLIVVAKGYKALASDTFTIGADVPEPVQLNINMVK